MSNLTRKCPICGVTISYTNKYNMIKADNKNSNCKSCGLKLTITEDRRERMKQRVLGDNNPMFGKFGELNPFFNKKHTEDTKQKMREKKDFSVYKTEEFREKMRILSLSNVTMFGDSTYYYYWVDKYGVEVAEEKMKKLKIKQSKNTSGENNPMFGKSVYDVWVEKYGTEIANVKLEQLKIKQSKNSSGENNPMFGKPSPVGSGNGWSGWYNNWFFRSIKELSYMINVIEKNNIEWINAESNMYQINYTDYKGNNRTYTADFILKNKYLIEIKPKKLWYSDSVVRKKISAIKFCDENNLTYKLRDTPNLSSKKLKELYETKQIIFTKRYEEKFVEKYLKNNVD
jgi:hypothetical protein